MAYLRSWFSATLAVGMLIGTAGQADTVAFRAGLHADKGFGRLVFEWPAPVGHDTRVENGRVVVRFERLITTDLTPALRHLGRILSDPRIDEGGRAVSFALNVPAEPRATTSGNLVIIDLHVGALPTQSSPAVTPAPPAASNPPTPVEATQASEPAAPEPAPAPTSAPVVPVRSANQPDFVRVVFDWSEKVDYVVAQTDEGVEIRFDRPGALKLDGKALRADKTIGAIVQVSPAGSPLSARIAAPEGARLRDGRSGTKVFVDIFDVPGARARPAAGPALPPETPTQTPTVPSAQATAEPAATPVMPTPEPAPSSASTVSHAGEQAGPASEAATSAPLATSAMAQTAEVPAGTEIAAPDVQATSPKEDTAKAATPVPSHVQGIPLDAGEPAGIAVYRRGEYLWVVFDRVLSREPAYVAAELNKALGGAAMVPNEPGSVFRFPLSGDRSARVALREGTWHFVLDHDGGTVSRPLAARAEPEFPLGPRIFIPFSGKAKVIPRYDQELGRIYVVTTDQDGAAFVNEQRFPEAEIIPTLQGAVIRPIGDDVGVRVIDDGIEIVGPNGLQLAPATDRPDMLAESAMGNDMLLPVAIWQRGGVETFSDQRQLLLRRVHDAAQGDKNKVRMDLARFYFAHGYAQESLGVLKTVEEAVPGIAGRPEFKALRGAALAFAGEADAALADLRDPRLMGEPEAAIFRALAYVRLRSWNDAATEFGTAGPLADAYPQPFLRSVVLAAAETALSQGNPLVARSMLDRLAAKLAGQSDDPGAVDFLRGESYRVEGNYPLAKDMLQRAAGSRDQYYAARARLSLTEIHVNEKSLTPKQAADELDGLRFSWRGDELELDILARMGKFRLEAGEWEAGMAALQEVVVKFPNHHRTPAITAELNDTFAHIFLNADMRANVEPTRAFAILRKFGQLIPPGAEGDRIIETLAQTLADADHLDHAALLLKDLMEHRLGGTEKSRVGAKLASVRLLIGDPDGALSALSGSESESAPATLVRERRLLQARALSELGKIDEAAAVLESDNSREAELLRVDFWWRSRQWKEASQGLAQLLDPPPAPGAALSPDSARMVLNQAVLLTLAGDEAGLVRLRDAYGPAMERSPDADAFRLITRPETLEGSLTLSTIRQRVGEVDVFRSFLDSYRRRAATNPGPVAGQPPPSGTIP